MSETTSSPPRAALFRAAIADFLRDRGEGKLKGLDAEKAAATAAKYEYSAWLADAARRVEQIQAVTHVLKATHPDARGSSLHVVPDSLPPHPEIGTHTLGKDYADDIVGNAAALDVYKFLKIQVQDRRLLDWLMQDDADLLAALSEDPAIAQAWADAFKALIRPAATLSSHGKAKQVYWCCNLEPAKNEGFHLLQPLFPSALVHAVHQEINDARFGETNTQARHARRAEKPFDGINREYMHLAVCKLGGSKPQNISQLNSERGGVNYLLNSLPPQWQSQTEKFLNIDSVFKHLRYYENVPDLLNTLCQLLKNNPKPTMETRRQREVIEQALGQALAAFGLSVQYARQPGWTRAAECQLPLCEQIWLDPERADLPVREGCEEEDIAFTQAFERKDWPDEVATRFGLWLNDILRQQIENFPVGDVEIRHWARQAIIDAVDWPATMQRHAMPNAMQQEATHG